LKKKLTILLQIPLFIVSCTILPKTTQVPVNSVELEKKALSDTLYTAQSYLEMAHQAENMGDSLNTDYYFSQAMEFINSFREAHFEPFDSSSQKVIEKISLEYARYLSRLNGIESDSLSAANVMNVIESLQDSLISKELDSTLVTIQDVIEEEEQLSIPLELNQKVHNVIHYFQTKGRKVFTKWLQRAGKYEDMISRILKEEGVPSELLYLAMIESGFNPHARSYARAVGMWQFISGTGRAYGLRSSWWFDDRRDPEKSTRAAAKHLKDLFERFNENWYLAIAGYNYSPGRIESKIKQYKVNDFWSLPRLPRQTRNYVPTFIGATIMAKDPEKYGFFVEPEATIEYDTVTVRECVDLNVVANCVDTTYSALKNLNPALLRFCTPPDQRSWVLNIPKNTRQKFIENYGKVPDEKKLTWVRHQIKSGETLSGIASRYGVSISELKRINNISGSLIRAGRSMVIPVPQVKKYYASNRQPLPPKTTTIPKPVTNVPNHDKDVHIVQKNETLWNIANYYGIKISDLRRWNGLSPYSKIIKPGQKLNVWLPSESPMLANATKQNFSQGEDITNLPKINSDGKTIIYTVRSGDTLWDISTHYGISIQQIKKWNNKRSNLIKPGDVLTIIVPE
jgi:membrane-bound lytic murein transglycosylase D